MLVLLRNRNGFGGGEGRGLTLVSSGRGPAFARRFRASFSGANMNVGFGTRNGRAAETKIR